MRTYELHPQVHTIRYCGGLLDLPTKARVNCTTGIDAATRARLDECLALKGIEALDNQDSADGSDDRSATCHDGADSAGLTVTVGIHDSGDAADAEVARLMESGRLRYVDGCFDHTDAYLLALLPATGSDGARIVVLGRTGDAAFYALSTLYQILQQTEGRTVEELTVGDWADTASRGFVEGYYGTPWSVEDRVELMRWSGYFKLNTYLYAPKNVELHRADWRSLYPEDRLDREIRVEAAAGEASKVRFVYALAPFGGDEFVEGESEKSSGSGESGQCGSTTSAPFRFDSEEHYREDFKALTGKYRQVIDAGVRHIALLADDAADLAKTYGPDVTYIRMLADLTDWLRALASEESADGGLRYEGLSDTILFCPPSYAGYGEEWYSRIPSNVKIIMTGGRTFGAATQEFSDRFAAATASAESTGAGDDGSCGDDAGGDGVGSKPAAQSGRRPFMWINWPCSDMNRNADYQYLVMGGQSTFLSPGVLPGSFEGLMLNAMQQSEPSKHAIFMAADYSWNLWKTPVEGNSSWEFAFGYIDHGSRTPTPASMALRDMCEHMRVLPDGGIDGVADSDLYDARHQWWINEETVDYRLGGQRGEGTGRISALAYLKAAAECTDGSMEVTNTMLDHALTIYHLMAIDARTYLGYAGNKRLRDQIEPFLGFWGDLGLAMEGYLGTASLLLMKHHEYDARRAFRWSERFMERAENHTVDDCYHQGKPARGGLRSLYPTVVALRGWVKARIVL